MKKKLEICCYSVESAINADNKIIIMPGSGVNEKNLNELVQKTKALEFHSSVKVFENSEMEFINKNISMGGVDDVDESKHVAVDKNSINMMVKILLG
ncbi:MAG: hypothetical protein KAS71_01450 [Bacteroidales bacterium]|nr:hypothetical protein [Bacteroidales bacterium]